MGTFKVTNDITVSAAGGHLFYPGPRRHGRGGDHHHGGRGDDVKAAASYGFYPWLIATVTYYGADNLGKEKNLNIGVGDYNASQIIQFDLTTKF